jgi:hypothetical protein
MTCHPYHKAEKNVVYFIKDWPVSLENKIVSFKIKYMKLASL